MWSIVSGPGPVTINDPNLTNTTVEFSIPGTYVLQLSAYDGQYTVNSNMTIQVLQNQPPVVSAGTNQFLTNTASTVLAGTVSDDGLPYHETNIVWSLLSSVPYATVSFSSSNVISPTVTFNTNYYGTYTFLLTVDDGQATNSAEVSVTVLSPSLTLTPGEGEGTPTNAPYTVTARLLGENGQPMAGSSVNFSVIGVNNTNGSAMTDSNGYAHFSYSYMASYLGEDTITASAVGGISSSVVNYWAASIDCGSTYTIPTLSSSGSPSIEWPSFPSDYYSFSGTVGDSISLGILQNSEAMMIYLKNLSGQIVAATTPSYDQQNSYNQLNYTLATNGNYKLWKCPAETSCYYTLYLNCSSETNDAPSMEVFYGSTNVPSNGTVTFPNTSVGTTTNVILTITNAAAIHHSKSLVLERMGILVMTNNAVGDVIPPVGQPILTLRMMPLRTGVSFGGLVLAANYPVGSNYIVYFMANTSPTGAVPSVQIISPANGSTFFQYQQMFFTTLVTPGSAPISTVQFESIDTNSITDYGSPYFEPDIGDEYTNEYSFPIGDYSVSVLAQDFNGQSGTAQPIIIHVVPFVGSSLTNVYQMEVLSNGTNLPTGGTVTFPQTTPGLATNLILTITNMGNYPLAIPEVQLDGDLGHAQIMPAPPSCLEPQPISPSYSMRLRPGRARVN